MNLLRAAATVSGLTLLSRITGLVREYVTAAMFGASSLTDAFFVAFRLPNLLRRLFAEGAFSQAFVPILAEARARESQDDVKRLVDRVATLLFWALLVVTVAGVVFAPGLVRLVAGGLQKDPEAFGTAVSLTRWMFPYIFFVSLVALAAGVLNTWKRFALPAFTPVLLNVSFIAAAVFLAPVTTPPIHALAVGVLVGGVLQLAIQLPALHRLGLLPRPSVNLVAAWRDERVRRVVRQMGPAVLAVSVAQVSLLINTHIASRLAAGSVSWITYGDRLMEFPSALLGVALGSVLLPSLSQASATGRHDDYRTLMDWGLKLSLLLSLPAALALGLAAEPLTALLFHYGRFDAHDLRMTALTVAAYGVGLPALVAIKILAPGFYAKQDIRTPVRIGLGVLVFTQLLNLVLVPLMDHAGLALSISLGALANAAFLLSGLMRRGLWTPLPGWRRTLLQAAGGMVVLAAWLHFSVQAFDWAALQARPALRIGLVLGLCAAGGVAYLGTLALLGVRPKDFRRRQAT